MLTGFQEEIPYCSPGISSGKQKKARSTSQPHFCSKNTPATLEADQIFLALQQLAIKTMPRISITTSTKPQNCASPSRQECPPSKGNQKKLKKKDMDSKQVWKFTTNSQKKTK